MSLKLSDNGYEVIMAQIQKIEDLTWKGVYPDNLPANKNNQSYYRFLDIVSEIKILRHILHENFLITPKPADTGRYPAA